MKKKLLSVFIIGMTCAMFLYGCGGKKENTKDSAGSADTGSGEQSSVLKGDKFTSNEGDITMTLPDGTWTCDMDDENGVNLTSKEGTISIVRLGAEEAKNTTVPTNEDAFTQQLAGMYVEGDFAVEDFSYKKGDPEQYQGAVSFDKTNAMGYGVYRGIYGSKGGYTISAALTDVEPDVEASVKTAIFELKVK